jgi:hypothetical protein
MLNPAEELGLSGMGLDGRARKAFSTIPEPTLLGLIRRLEGEALRRHLVYFRDGRSEPIRILPRPLTVLPEQLAYIHSVSLTLLNALKSLPELYLGSPAIRDLLRLDPEEEAWFRECWGPGGRESDPVFGRLDAAVDFASPMWQDSLQFVEPNLTGVGGIHLVPTCERIVADVVLPALNECDEGLRLELGHDIRELLMREMLDHLDSLGRPRRNIGFIEPTHAGTGPDEQEALARYYRDRYGMSVLHADPSELALRAGEVVCQGEPLELAYRDYEVRDLLALEREGVDVEPVRVLFRQNRIVSSITGEFDQKSCWEVLTDPELAHRHFHSDERQIFRRHIPWTRLLTDRRTLLPDGRRGDLLDYVRHHREVLVLKPNRGYGGSGVAIGPALGQAEWESALDGALADDSRWVVQRRVSLPVSEFPVVGPDGALRVEPFYLVMGFAPSRYGLSVLARASRQQVVNVAQRGGLCAVMVGPPPDRLVVPGPKPIGAPRMTPRDTD